MGFSRQKYWSGLTFPSAGDLPNPGIETCLLQCRWILYGLSYKERNCQTVTNLVVSLCIQSAMDESSCCSVSFLAFVVSVLNFGHSKSCVVYLLAVLICNSVMRYNVDYLFICLFAICISSLMKCLFRSLPLF